MILKFNDFKKVNENVLANSTNVALMDSLDIEDKYKPIISSIVANTNITDKDLLDAGLNTIAKLLKTNTKTISPDLKMEELIEMLLTSNDGGLLNAIETTISLMAYGDESSACIINTQKSITDNNTTYQLGYVSAGGNSSYGGSYQTSNQNLYFGVSNIESLSYRKGNTTIYWIFSPIISGDRSGYSILLKHIDGASTAQYAYDTEEMSEKHEEIIEKYRLDDVNRVDLNNIKPAYEEISALFNDIASRVDRINVEIRTNDIKQLNIYSDKHFPRRS
jgi:hypothetical protein